MTQRLVNVKGPFNLYVWNDNFIKLVIEYLSKEQDIVSDPFAAFRLCLGLQKK